MNRNSLQFAFLGMLFLAGCGGDDETPEVEEAGKTSAPAVDTEIPSQPLTNDPSSDATISTSTKILKEKLDQAQEKFDEGSVTSFGVGERGWQTYTASKNGFLTHFHLYGEATTQGALHKGRKMYGDAVEGVILLDGNGTTLGTWRLTRDEVVKQLAAQNLRPDERFGWIDVRIEGEQLIPQVAGETYRIQVTKISGGSPWFGSFLFNPRDPYPDGEWWHSKALGKPCDLVFRTYVGKTAGLIAEERVRNRALMEQHLQSNPSNDTPEGAPEPIPDPPTEKPEITPLVPPKPSPPVPPKPSPPVGEGNATKPGGAKPFFFRPK